MPGCGKKDVDKAVQNAKKAQEKWVDLSGFERMKILQNASILLKVLFYGSWFEFLFYILVKTSIFFGKFCN